MQKIYKVKGVYFTDQNKASKFADEVGAYLIQVLTPDCYEAKEYYYAKELLNV